VDALLDDPVFFAPFAPYFHPVLGRPSTPVERPGLLKDL
jgi:transposase, IS5 family